MAIFHSGSEGQSQKLTVLRRRQRLLLFRARLLPPICWALSVLTALWWFPPLKDALSADVRFRAWVIVALFTVLLSAPVLVSFRLKRRAKGAKYAATLVSSGIHGEEDARAMLERLPNSVHVYPNRIVHAGNRSECDLVALTRRGATIIEVKNHAGRVTGDYSDHDLLLTRKNGDPLTFYNPVMQVTTHAQTLARAIADGGVPSPVKKCVMFVREGTEVKLTDRFHAHRTTPVFTRRNRFRLRFLILHRGKRLRRREFRQLCRLLEDMK